GDGPAAARCRVDETGAGVDDEVDEYVDDADDEADTHDDGQVECGGSAEGVLADAVPGEDGLGEHRAGQERAEGETDDRDDRNEGASEDVFEYDGASRQAFGPSRDRKSTRLNSS